MVQINYYYYLNEPKAFTVMKCYDSIVLQPWLLRTIRFCIPKTHESPAHAFQCILQHDETRIITVPLYNITQYRKQKRLSKIFETGSGYIVLQCKQKRSNLIRSASLKKKVSFSLKLTRSGVNAFLKCRNFHFPIQSSAWNQRKSTGCN